MADGLFSPKTVLLLLLLLWPTSTKPIGVNIEVKQMWLAATVLQLVIMVFWKKTATIIIITTNIITCRD